LLLADNGGDAVFRNGTTEADKLAHKKISTKDTKNTKAWRQNAPPFPFRVLVAFVEVFVKRAEPGETAQRRKEITDPSLRLYAFA
jgi:hypothetical protein